MKNPAAPQDVAEVIREAISTESPRAQYRVGVDAEALWGLVESAPREEFVRIAALPDDTQYLAELARKVVHLA